MELQILLVAESTTRVALKRKPVEAADELIAILNKHSRVRVPQSLETEIRIFARELTQPVSGRLMLGSKTRRRLFVDSLSDEDRDIALEKRFQFF